MHLQGDDLVKLFFNTEHTRFVYVFFKFFRQNILMNCNLTGACVDVTLEAYKHVTPGTNPFVVVQYVLCRLTDQG